MANTKYNSTENMINKLQTLKGKTKMNFYKSLSNYYNEMKNKNFLSERDPFAKNAQSISKNYHEVLILIKYLQTKPQNKSMNTNYHELYYTTNKDRDENKDIDHQNEDEDNDCIIFNDIIPNQYVGVKKIISKYSGSEI